MGIFKKIFKGIGKAFKKVGGWIKKGWAKLGKFMNKFGILGQLGMMYISSLIGGYAMQFLGKVGSGVMGKIAIAAKNGNRFAQAAETVANGVRSIAKIPQTMIKEAGRTLGSITDVVTGTVGDTLRFIGDKTGISAALRNSLPTEGYFSRFRPESLQEFARDDAGKLMRDASGKLVKTGVGVAPAGLTAEGADAIFLNFANRLGNVLPTALDSGVNIYKGIKEGLTDFGKVLAGKYTPDYKFETYMVDRDPSLFNPSGKPKEVTRNILDPKNAIDYDKSFQKYNSQTSNYGGEQGYQDYQQRQYADQTKKMVDLNQWQHEQSTFRGVRASDPMAERALLGREATLSSLGQKTPEAIRAEGAVSTLGTRAYEKASKVLSKGPSIGDTMTQGFTSAGINELLYGSMEPEAPHASYQALADTAAGTHPLTLGPTAGQETDPVQFAYNNSEQFFSPANMYGGDDGGEGSWVYNQWLSGQQQFGIA